MRKFSVYGLVTASKYLGEWEADTPDEAIDKALESTANHFSVCHQCSREFDLDEHSCQSATAEEIV